MRYREERREREKDIYKNAMNGMYALETATRRGIIVSTCTRVDNECVCETDEGMG